MISNRVTHNSNSASTLITMLHLRRLLTIVLLMQLSSVSFNGQAEARGGVYTRGWPLMKKLGWQTAFGRGLLKMRFGEREAGAVSEVVHDKGMLQSGSCGRVSRGRWLQEAGTYCVAIGTADQMALQAALDWACSQDKGNVNCGPLQEGGSCYEPNDLVHHASYAFNSYYLAQNGATGSCSFSGVATTTTINPSNGTCVYQALGSSSTTAISPSSDPPSNTTPTNTTTETSSSSSIVLASSITYTLCAIVTSLILAMELANFPFKTFLTLI